MLITFRIATCEDDQTIERLFQLFGHDSSEFGGMDIEKDGLFHGIYDMKDYTSLQKYKTLFIDVDNHLAGFVVIRFEEDINYLRHFFILRKYRKQNIGKQSVHMIFNQYPGNWRVSTMDFNEPAIKFWESTLKQYTQDHYLKMRRADDKGPQYEIYK